MITSSGKLTAKREQVEATATLKTFPVPGGTVYTTEFFLESGTSNDTTEPSPSSRSVLESSQARR